MSENKLKTYSDGKLKTYSDVIGRVNDLLRSIESTDDIDAVLEMYEEAVHHLNDCDLRLKHATGRFETIASSLQPST